LVSGKTTGSQRMLSKRQNLAPIFSFVLSSIILSTHAITSEELVCGIVNRSIPREIAANVDHKTLASALYNYDKKFSLCVAANGHTKLLKRLFNDENLVYCRQRIADLDSLLHSAVRGPQKIYHNEMRPVFVETIRKVKPDGVLIALWCLFY